MQLIYCGREKKKKKKKKKDYSPVKILFSNFSFLKY